MIFLQPASETCVPEQVVSQLSIVILPHAGSSSGAFHIPAVQERRADGQSLREAISVTLRRQLVCICLRVYRIP